MTVRKASKATERELLLEHSKAAFIRQHLNLPAREIIARAKSAGLALDPAYIYAARDSAIGKRKASLLVREDSDEQRDCASKAAFVRQFLDLPTREIVRRGEAAGLAIRPEYVRRVRERVGVGTVKNPAAFIRHHLDRSEPEIVARGKVFGLTITPGMIAALRPFGRPGERASFVRRHMTLSTDEIIERAKSAGLFVSRAYVAVIRRATARASSAVVHSPIIPQAFRSMAKVVECDEPPRVATGNLDPKPVGCAMNRARVEPRAEAPGLAMLLTLELKPRKRRGSHRRPKRKAQREREVSASTELETNFVRIAFELTVPRARELLDELEERLRELAHQLT